MLNEERVKQMIKLASYESGAGQEELEITSERRGRYIRRNVFSSIVWMSIAYALLMCFIYKGVLQAGGKSLDKGQQLIVFSLMGVAYFSLFIFYVVKSRFHYKKQYTRAYHNVKQFGQDLAVLENLYKEEGIHE
jgi:hypothetical protein